MTNLTPAMRQYLEIKQQYPDAVLFYRMGDFYEMFFEDAVTASRVLDITLTSRNKNKEDSIPLCGIPYHAASPYITKLIDKGFKVAICEQIEDPKTAKGVVKRSVVRVITPGLVLDSENLNAKENNYLAAIASAKDRFGLAFIDISTGDFRVCVSDEKDLLLHNLLTLDAKEILIDKDFKGNLLKAFASFTGTCLINRLPSEYFDSEKGLALLRSHFPEAALHDSDICTHPIVAAAAGAVLQYVKETQMDNLEHIVEIRRHEIDKCLILDDTARRNLELFTTIRDGKPEGSLLHVIDETITPMGGRRIRWLLKYPFVDPTIIRERLSAVAEIKDGHLLRNGLRRSLTEVADLERLAGRVSLGVAHARDLVALKTSLQALPKIKEHLAEISSSLLSCIAADLNMLPDISSLIDKAIVDDPPLDIRDGGIIREGYDAELDKLISISKDGKKWIAALEDKERKRTGISSLRVGFNSIFGYYIEITKSNAHLAPVDYIRKQTLVNAERYINQELKDYESTVLNAEEKSKAREYELFVHIRQTVATEVKAILKTAGLLADLDAVASLAEIAERYHYCCPRVDSEDLIEIHDGRHPVVERMPLPEGFVTNDTYLDCNEKRILIITGPNMAGKSTYIRQVAVIVLLAQMGSFVPASSARIGITDRIFTRVGAADSLTRGESTFMVEMKEVASILKNATGKSLILLDEVGRGTSTFDGLSIAWAVAEYVHDMEHLRSRTLFATHYHQLTDLSLTKDGVKNLSIAVKEWGDRIIFLRKIVEGGTNRSYGIQVASLAGVPAEVVTRAKEILENLERGELDEIGMPKIARGRKTAVIAKTAQLSLFADDETLILRELQDIDIMKMTPLDALTAIHKWKEILKR